MGRFINKVVVIFGVVSGIGVVMVVWLVEEDVVGLVLLDCNGENLKIVVQGLSVKIKVMVSVVDIVDEVQLIQVINEVYIIFGCFDVLCNNVGVVSS